MDTRKLVTFRSVAEAGSISRGAATLSLAQAVVSKHVKALEDDLGVQLFHRDGRGTVLTEAGQILDEHAKDVLGSIATVRARLDALRETPSGEIAIALPPSVGLILTVPLISRFRAEFPDIRIRLTEGFSGHVQEWLLTGRIDVAVLYDARKVASILSDNLVTEKLCVLGPIEGPHNPDGDTVTLAEAARLPLILPSRPHGLRLLVEKSVAQIGVEANVQMDVDAMPSTLRLAQSGAGYTILSQSTVHDRIQAGAIRSWRIVDPPIERNLLLATSTQRPMTVATREFTRIARSEVARLVESGVWGAKDVSA